MVFDDPEQFVNDIASVGTEDGTFNSRSPDKNAQFKITCIFLFLSHMLWEGKKKKRLNNQ